jgi:uncharacterized protein YlxW (UPF0749 family)
VAAGKQETIALRTEVTSLQAEVHTLRTRVHKLEHAGEVAPTEPAIEIELAPLNHLYSSEAASSAADEPLSPVRITSSLLHRC